MSAQDGYQKFNINEWLPIVPKALISFIFSSPRLDLLYNLRFSTPGK
ncbi:MAG: hypothetical protein JWQ61_1492 [Collimonas fungivorans]|nr:hypothetical protein [Collimonas fungivorans]